MPEPESVRVGPSRSAVRDTAASERQRRPDVESDPDHPADHHAIAVAQAHAVVAPGNTHPGVGAIALVRDATGRVLLVWQRNGPFAGSWLLPGGGVELSEGVSHAAARELREETGLTVTDGRVIATYQTRSEPPGDYDVTVFMYEVTATGELKAEAGSEVAWFLPADIPDPHPALRRQLFDAGVLVDDDAAIEDTLRDAGIQMERLG